MRSKSQILSKLRADGHITDEEYKLLEQKPKTGHWIEHGGWANDYSTKYSCSKCNGRTHQMSNFCPNCGAKMEVKEWY